MESDGMMKRDFSLGDVRTDDVRAYAEPDRDLTPIEQATKWIDGATERVALQVSRLEDRIGQVLVDAPPVMDDPVRTDTGASTLARTLSQRARHLEDIADRLDRIVARVEL